MTHLLGSIFGLILAIFGTFALGAYLANGRSGRMALVAMVVTVLGSALFLPAVGVSAFAAPEEGQAYLAGIEEFSELPPIFADTVFAATIGSQSTPRTVLVGALLIVIGGGWIAWSALHRPSAGALRVEAQPRVR